MKVYWVEHFWFQTWCSNCQRRERQQEGEGAPQWSARARAPHCAPLSSVHWLQLIFRLRFSPVFEYTWVQRRICGTPQDWTLLWDSQTCVNWKTTVNCAGTRSVVHCLFMFIHELPNFFMWNKTKLSLNSIRKFIKNLEVKYISVIVANHWSGSKGIWKCTKSFLSFLIVKIKILFLDFPTAKSTEVGREGRSSKLAQKSYVECWSMLGGEGKSRPFFQCVASEFPIRKDQL